MAKKLHHKTKSLLYLGIVAAAAIIAVIIVEYQANKSQEYNSPALLISKQRAKTPATSSKATAAKPINPTVKTTLPK